MTRNDALTRVLTLLGMVVMAYSHFRHTGQNVANVKLRYESC